MYCLCWMYWIFSVAGSVDFGYDQTSQPFEAVLPGNSEYWKWDLVRWRYSGCQISGYRADLQTWESRN